VVVSLSLSFIMKLLDWLWCCVCSFISDGFQRRFVLFCVQLCCSVYNFVVLCTTVLFCLLIMLFYVLIVSFCVLIVLFCVLIVLFCVLIVLFCLFNCVILCVNCVLLRVVLFCVLILLFCVK
jgi:hypothetical protein